MAADRRLFLDQIDLVAGIGEVERGLHAGNPTANHHDSADYLTLSGRTAYRHLPILHDTVFRQQ